MKKIYVLWSLAIATLMVNVFYACKSDDTLEEFYRKRGLTMNPAQSPDFVIYSNDNILATTFGNTRGETRADAQVNGNYFKVGDFGGKSDWMKNQYPVLYAVFDNAPKKTDRNEQVSQAEFEYVIDYIHNHPDEGGTECTIKDNYFIQNVGGCFVKYDSNTYPSLQDNNHAYHDVTGSNQMDYLTFGDTHINDYNAVNGPRALCIYNDLPLTSPAYRDTWGEWGNPNQIKHAYKYYYIEYPENTGTICCYLCFDYRTEKNSGEKFDGDDVYNDWVIKITPADGSEIKVPGDEPDDPIIEPDDSDDPDDPDDPVVTDEVEVNLSVNDEKEKDDYIATKLSIHIRALTDVEVFIPVKQEYYCDVDDMAIVLSHNLDPNYQYSNPGKDGTYVHGSYTYIYTVKSQEGDAVSANKEIKVTVTYETEGIRVKTQGVDQTVLDYLQYKYQDGITIEVWNYFNEAIPQVVEPGQQAITKVPVNRAELKPMLDKSTVTFTSQEHPEYYVNAFAMLYNFQKKDLHVYLKEEDGLPYLMYVTYDSDGHITSQTETNNPLSQEYWYKDSEGKVHFYGAKNAWDCVVTPPAAYQVVTTHTGDDPADFNVVYKK